MIDGNEGLTEEEKAEVLHDALTSAEEALAQGMENCGDDPDCMWADALQKVREAMKVR